MICKEVLGLSSQNIEMTSDKSQSNAFTGVTLVKSKTPPFHNISHKLVSSQFSK